MSRMRFSVAVAIFAVLAFSGPLLSGCGGGGYDGFASWGNRDEPDPEQKLPTPPAREDRGPIGGGKF